MYKIIVIFMGMNGFKLSYIANFVNGRLVGSDCDIFDVGGIGYTPAGSIVWAKNKKIARAFEGSACSAIIVGSEYDVEKPQIVVSSPQEAYYKVLELFYKEKNIDRVVSDRAIVGSNVVIEDNVAILPFAVIGDNTKIGSGSTIHHNVIIGSNVVIGSNAVIYPNVYIEDNTIIGNNVMIEVGSVIGGWGFGFYGSDKKRVKQLGNVIIGDNVEIGSNTCIDRATTGSTIIGDNTKIDNLCQIAHNVIIGRGCILAGQVGIAGSTTIGNNTILAGQVGVADHIKVGSNVIAAGGTSIVQDIDDNKVVFGYPARPMMESKRLFVMLSKLLKDYKYIEKIIKEYKKED